MLTIGGTNLGYQEGQVSVTVVDVPTALSSNTPSPSGLRLFSRVACRLFGTVGKVTAGSVSPVEETNLGSQVDQG